jgi:predicted  nucleic acid-binding Zn-ribbon protein
VDKLEKKLRKSSKIFWTMRRQQRASTEEQIQIIAQTIEGYRKEIEELKENITPTTPLRS